MKVGGGVDGKDRSLGGGGRLMPLHSLLSMGYESTSEARDILGMRRLRKENGDGSRKNNGVGNMLQFPINSLGDQFLLVAKQSVLADGSDANITESFKLGGASTKGGNIRGQIGSKSADIIGAKSREEKVELATVEEFVKNGGEGNRVDGDAGGRV
jgi:hypothetical protein